MPTPAEYLSSKKPWRRAPRNVVQVRHRVWKCLIREKREALRLSLRDVAAAIHLSVTALWQIEMGTDPQLTTARKLAAFFGCLTDELWPCLATKKRSK